MPAARIQAPTVNDLEVNETEVNEIDGIEIKTSNSLGTRKNRAYRHSIHGVTITAREGRTVA